MGVRRQAPLSDLRYVIDGPRVSKLLVFANTDGDQVLFFLHRHGRVRVFRVA